MWRGKERALDEVYGKWSDSFELLFRWKAELMKCCPGSVVEIDVLEVDGQIYFHRFFCALKPCIDGFLQGCRAHLSIDATTLNGRWNGHLAAATAVDGHNWMYPLAYGFIVREDTKNWTWFMEQLKKAIGDPPLLAICSHACKGLENAVKNVFPNAEQRECFYHLVKNFKKAYRGYGQIYPAARAYRADIFYENIAKMLTESLAAVQWLQKNHKYLWYRHAFNPEIKCDYITNNVAESFNNWIRDHKDLSVADLDDNIREKIMVLWSKRRNIAFRLPEGKILQAIMVQLKANTRGLGHLRIVPCSNLSAEVWDHTSTRVERHIVKLHQRICSCLEWQHTGKPCQHVLAYVTRQRGVDLEQFVHDYYSVNRFKAAYTSSLTSANPCFRPSISCGSSGMASTEGNRQSCNHAIARNYVNPLKIGRKQVIARNHMPHPLKIGLIDQLIHERRKHICQLQGTTHGRRKKGSPLCWCQGSK
jgi:hypothetical protein